MFRKLVPTVVFVVCCIAPVFARASDGSQITRAQVNAELAELEKAGYNPATDDNATYPEKMQAAQARVAAQKGQSGYGDPGVGRSASGVSLRPGISRRPDASDQQ